MKSTATWASGCWARTNSISSTAIVEIGARRARQRVPLSEVVQAIVLTKENLWEFLKSEAVMDRAVEIMGELELLQMLEMFFDRAIYYAAVGYEEEAARDARKKATLKGKLGERKGCRCHGKWNTRSGCKTADEALACVKSGMRVYIQPGCAEPETLVEALMRRAPELIRRRNRSHDDHGLRALRGAGDGGPLPA